MTKFVIVGEAWGEAEEAAGAPFVGASGQLLNRMLAAAGIRRGDCHLTNVFNFRPANNKLASICGPREAAIPGWPQLGQKLWPRAEHARELDRLFRELAEHQPTVIIALGSTALWALTKINSIKKYRGTPILDYTSTYKILPTYHPAAVLRQWSLRPVVIADFEKALSESEFREIRRPKRLIYLEPSLEDIEDFYKKYIRGSASVSCDIETKTIGKLRTITEVGFAPSPDRAIVIPFFSRNIRGHSYWPTPEFEFEAWAWVERICKEKVLFGQNFNYDISYLWHEMGIAIPRIGPDTMILHHALYPELEKSLGFLGSLYTKEPSWKFMRQSNEGLKAED